MIFLPFVAYESCSPQGEITRFLEHDKLHTSSIYMILSLPHSFDLFPFVAGLLLLASSVNCCFISGCDIDWIMESACAKNLSRYLCVTCGCYDFYYIDLTSNTVASIENCPTQTQACIP